MGGFKYSELFPPHSLINALNFESPRHLAEYLHYLDSHDDEYLSYFWWHDYYVAKPYPTKAVFCKLCEMLNDPDQPTQAYQNMHSWFREGKCHNGSFPWSSYETLWKKGKSKKSLLAGEF